jgi:hypothetical protein
VVSKAWIHKSVAGRPRGRHGETCRGVLSYVWAWGPPIDMKMSGVVRVRCWSVEGEGLFTLWIK